MENRGKFYGGFGYFGNNNEILWFILVFLLLFRDGYGGYGNNLGAFYKE